MAKERKTKRQKKASDLRHSHDSITANNETVYKLDLKSADKSIASNKPSSSQKDYSYLTHDLKKSGIVTGIIVLFELGVYWIAVGY